MRMDIQDVGRRTYELREERHWSQEELAKAAKTTQATISRIEKGTYGEPGLTLIENLATAFGMTISEFIGQKSSEDDPIIREVMAVMEPMSEYDKKAALGAVRGIYDAGRKAG